MNILLFGKGGQVGWELQRSLAPLGRIVALDWQPEGRLCGDFTDLAGLAACVRAVAPDVVVNAAAHTAVDQAESEPERARTINALAPAVLAAEAARLNAWLVHYSTDYVFDGSGDTAWREGDATGPLGVYGRTKLAGEQAVAGHDRHLIFRTSWVFAARGNNFARTMLRLANEREQIKVVADQIGAPTGAELLADVTAHAIRRVCQQPDLAGLYHLVAAGETSWHGYARHVIERARQAGQAIRVAPDAIVAVPSSAYPAPAPRPLNSRLDTRKLQTAFDLRLPDWQDGVDRMLEEILGR
ncbi:MAG: dTDP-4-dehydrorhamnose reductase [Candidatus Accumulibacter sp.]|uniref:dTDP-4-dehydrorhamnose reductase n=1 Tax=Accumulibacter sp. TaxID=2053492 RepID=UPI0020846E2D|nr:dTDP-4-dehydrorhamnose reductase [Accumulibacter sp.]MBK8116900.1 dTDP-4-dehydrorhamnose reductase [Accumulibacter sp.]MBK8580042.1 dTDP-4-dehydrorhamnose reductase [Candidatus Accumulibacter propinquus]